MTGNLYDLFAKFLSLERNINCGIFSKKIEGNTGAKICCLFDINDLSMEEVTLLKVFNLWFGEGVSSVLYDEIRTKNGLAYEVYSQVKYEKGIRLFKIYLALFRKTCIIIIMTKPKALCCKGYFFCTFKIISFYIKLHFSFTFTVKLTYFT